MSLINDAIKLNATEKELHHLDYPFRTIPAMKIAKLAVSRKHREQYQGIDINRAGWKIESLTKRLRLPYDDRHYNALRYSRGCDGKRVVPHAKATALL
jgi:hypothetical protein